MSQIWRLSVIEPLRLLVYRHIADTDVTHFRTHCNEEHMALCRPGRAPHG